MSFTGSIVWTGFWATYTHDMAHRHVLIGYGFAWLVQLAYLASVLRRSRGDHKPGSGTAAQ